MKDSSTATERVGRYQLLEPVGGGPNGMVSRAKVFGVAGFERQFAVKRFLPELTVGPIAQALSAAARSYGSLEHPRIARMAEFGVAQGQTFTAVEYVAGLDGFRLMQEAKLAGIGIAAGGALALVSQAARAVGYAHGRGLSHLGLSPTNVIVTADGDVKVTDFGILAATMPPRPVEVQRLAPRIPYLAPEQLSGEATSAATDVFVLGVIAYELVTGQRAYRGETASQIAQAIQAGPPAEPPLPRPIVRVLQRCLARSPFERFPDARALADALDAALRVAPVPGTRKDIGAQIKATLDRYASLNEGNLSGMVALNLQTAQAAAATGDQAEPYSRPYTRDEARTEPSPMPIVSAPDSTHRDLPKAFNTVPGVPPPPIPVPPGVTPPPAPPISAGAVSPKTMIGVPAIRKPMIPSIVPPAKKPNGPLAAPPPPPRRPTPPPMPAVQPEMIDDSMVEVEESVPIKVPSPPSDPEDTSEAFRPIGESGPLHLGEAPPDDQVTRPGSAPGEQDFDSQTGEMSQHQVEQYRGRSVQVTSELETIERPQQVASGPYDRAAVSGEFTPPPELRAPPPIDAPTPIVRAQTAPGATQPAPPPAAKAPRAPASNKGMIVAISVLALAGLGAAGWFAYTTLKEPEPTKIAKTSHGSNAVAKGPDDKGSAKGPDKGSASKPPDQGSAKGPDSPDKGSAANAKGSAKGPDDKGSAKGPDDKGSAKGPDKGSAKGPDDKGSAKGPDDKGTPDKPAVKPTSSSDSLQVNSKPAGARVFIDGADQGATPVKLPGSTDRHTMVVLQPGYELYIGEVDGHGVFDVTLKAVTPSGGHAGIKVIKCKAKERYYVYVDGAATGMTCPTERIDTVVGPHAVEVYDIVTDSRRKFDITVKDERLSARVRIDDN